ncbi:MAG TPA: hypothetical protein VLS93_08670, partial [Anaeromyxobacteraceae bacterium]|nr:hypothetical protein [Anaeromyxobacteraceae bacterium]
LRVLEGLGLVSLSPGEDQRDRMAALTRGGRARLRAAARAWAKVQESPSGTLGADAGQLVAISRHLSRLPEVAVKYVIGRG